MLIIDAHAHLDDRVLDAGAMAMQMQAAKIDKIALIPFINDPLPRTPHALLAAMRWLMESKAHPLAKWVNARFMTDEGNLALQGQEFRIYTRPDNATVAAAIDAHPDKFLGWLFLNPRSIDDDLVLLERYGRRPSYIGVKLHPHWHAYDLRLALPIARQCEAMRLPMLIHLGFGAAGEWKVLSDACPKLTLIFAHAGFPTYKRMWNEMRDCPNVWVDVSSPYIDEALVRRAVEVLGPRKVLYGTDAPYGFERSDGAYDFDHIKGWVERLPVRAEEIDAVFGGNIETLLSREHVGSKGK